MANLTNALQELRAERSRAQLHLEKLDQAISVIESLNGSGRSGNTTQAKRIISAASRRKMALAQKARWARAGKKIKPVVIAAKASSSAAKRIMSASARRKIVAAQRARWAKVRAKQKKAA
jgi:leucyl aminopeptidase (aminopeptidase T)